MVLRRKLHEKMLLMNWRSVELIHRARIYVIMELNRHIASTYTQITDFPQEKDNIIKNTYKWKQLSASSHYIKNNNYIKSTVELCVGSKRKIVL